MTTRSRTDRTAPTPGGRPAGRLRAAAGPGSERLRHAWLLAAVWLIFLNDPLTELRKRPAGWAQVTGLVALALFAALYLTSLGLGRSRRRAMRPLHAAHNWAPLGALAALLALVIPGAGEHALAAAPYIAVLAIMNLSVRAGVITACAIAVGTELALRLVPGWQYDAYSAAVALASVAVLGMRLAIDRSVRLIAAQEELSALAVENERARIAQDLHDILGHSLTVVTIKAELAQRLLDVDLDRARAELRDLEALSRDALADVRATALGVRGVSLPGEIAAARSALLAADVEAELPTAADEVPSRWRELFAWTIREAVTNLVRHSKATRCTITLTPRSVEIIDDGVGEGAGDRPHGSQGLEGLRRRAEAVGGHFTAGNRLDAPGFRVLMEAPS